MMERALIRFPNNPWMGLYASLLASSHGDYHTAGARLLALREQHGDTRFWRAQVSEAARPTRICAW